MKAFFDRFNFALIKSVAYKLFVFVTVLGLNTATKLDILFISTNTLDFIDTNICF